MVTRFDNQNWQAVSAVEWIDPKNKNESRSTILLTNVPGWVTGSKLDFKRLQQ